MIYLDKKKKEVEETNKQKLLREEEENQRRKDVKKIWVILELEDKLKSAKEHQNHHKKACDQLLLDANKRFKKAIDKNDLIEIKIAQSMVEAATKLRNEEREKEIETMNIQNKIEKRKNNIITKFVKKSKNDWLFIVIIFIIIHYI